MEPTTTISDLEAQIYLKHKVPIRGRCVVLLETTLPSQENHDGAGILSGGSSADGQELSTNAVDMTNGTAMENGILLKILTIFISNIFWKEIFYV